MQDPVATFCSPQTRFWELLCGSLLAWFTIYKKSLYAAIGAKLDGWLGAALHENAPEADGKTLSNVLSFVGLFLLVYAFWRINKDCTFPGTWAVVPVLGAVLIILAGPKAWVNRTIFSNRIAVRFGLISFPLYLWHWPLLSFGRIVEGAGPNGAILGAVLALSVVLAWLTYKLVEKHVRLERNGKIKVTALVILMAVIGTVGYYTYERNGLGFRFPTIIQELTQYKYDYRAAYREGTCFLRPEQDYRSFEGCDNVSPSGTKTLLLWGDSFAAHLYQGCLRSFGDRFTILQRTASFCPPILGLEINGRVHCKEINDSTFDFIDNIRPDRVVLAAGWGVAYADKLDETVLRLKNLGIKNIDLIGIVPIWIEELPKELYKYFTKYTPHVIPYRMSFGLSQEHLKLDDIFRRKAVELNVNYVSPIAIMCDGDGCITRLGETGDHLTAWDRGHLTTAGSEFLVARFPKY